MEVPISTQYLHYSKYSIISRWDLSPLSLPLQSLGGLVHPLNFAAYILTKIQSRSCAEEIVLPLFDSFLSPRSECTSLAGCSRNDHIPYNSNPVHSIHASAHSCIVSSSRLRFYKHCCSQVSASATPNHCHSLFSHRSCRSSPPQPPPSQQLEPAGMRS